MELNTVLQIQVKNYPGRLKSYLVGKEDGRFLIIKVPIVGEPTTIFAPGQELVVRYVYQGNVYGFHSSIMYVLLDSFQVAFIEFPKKIENVNLRTFKRFDCYLPASLQVQARVQDRNLIFQGTIIDISKGGCKMAIGLHELEWVTEPLQIQSAVEIHVALPGVENELELRGKVKSMTKNDESLLLGVQFIELDGKAKTELYKFIAANEG